MYKQTLVSLLANASWLTKTSVKKQRTPGAAATTPGLPETTHPPFFFLLTGAQYVLFPPPLLLTLHPVPVVSPAFGRPSQARPHQQPRPSRADSRRSRRATTGRNSRQTPKDSLGGLDDDSGCPEPASLCSSGWDPHHIPRPPRTIRCACVGCISVHLPHNGDPGCSACFHQV